MGEIHMLVKLDCSGVRRGIPFYGSFNENYHLTLEELLGKVPNYSSNSVADELYLKRSHRFSAHKCSMGTIGGGGEGDIIEN